MFNIKYAFEQDMPNQIVATILLVLIYPFIPKKLKKNYLLLFIIPAYAGTLFPDLSYLILYILLKSNHYVLSHSPSFTLLIIPVAQIVVYFINKVRKNKLPEYWYIITAFVSTVFSWIHIIVDKLGY